jgi:protoheme IX farnesyltransferase
MRSEAVVLAASKSRAADFAALAKPRLNMLVVMSALAGYLMGTTEGIAPLPLLATLAGTGLVAGGASAFNQLLERDLDGLMRRTRMRPLPDRRLQPVEAAIFGALITITGLLVLAAFANLLAAGVALVTHLSYVVVYTPLKRRSSFGTVIGGIPGALPPVIGWAAARGALTSEAWTLFGIVFLWQLPHFLAIAWMYREDYGRAGYPMLPVLEPDGHSTARQSLIYATALLPLSLAPTLLGLTGKIYFAGALVLGVWYMYLAFRFVRTRDVRDARRLFFGSIVYLPLVWILMIANKL